MSQFPPSSFDPNLVEFAEKPPVWPLVIGWISIAWAGLGSVCGVCGIGLLAVAPSFMPKDQGPLPPSMQLSGGMIAMGITGVLMAVLLLTCGIMCIRRNPACRPIFLVYAVLGLLSLVFSLYIQFQQAESMARWAAENPDSPFAAGYKNPAQVRASQIGGMIFGVVLGGAWPVFLLVWFGLIKTRAEQFGKPAAIVA